MRHLKPGAAAGVDAATTVTVKDADYFFDLTQTKSLERKNSELLSECERFESIRVHRR